MDDDPLYLEAVGRLQAIFDRARRSDLVNPMAAALATSDGAGHPTVRMVLVRHFDVRGACFYTNADSAKGRQLSQCPRAALCWYWGPLGQQVRLEGPTEPVGDEASDAYWRARPRHSQLASQASQQSQPLASREELEQRVAHLEQRYVGQPVPRPERWYGYRLRPDRIEIWQERRARLHHRLLYYLVGGAWQRQLLQP